MSQEITVPEFYSKKNNNDIGVVLITPNQMICRSSKDNYHISIVNEIYKKIYNVEFSSNEEDWISIVTSKFNNIFVKMTKTDFLVYLPEYITTSQYQMLNILNQQIKKMMYPTFKISYVDMRFFDKNHENLDVLTSYFFTHIYDDIDIEENFMEEKQKTR